MQRIQVNLPIVLFTLAVSAAIATRGGSPSSQPANPQAVTRPSLSPGGAMAALDKARGNCIERLGNDANYRAAVAAEKVAEQRLSAASDEDRANAATDLLAKRVEVFKIESAAFATDKGVIQAQQDLDEARRASAASKPNPPAMNVPAMKSDPTAITPGVSFLESQVVFPGSSTQGQATAILRPMAGCDLLTLHAPDGTKIAAFFGKAPSLPGSTAKPTLLYFYGNGTCMAFSRDVFGGFRSLGFNVIMVDYEGYGMSDGVPSEQGCYAAADAAYDYLLTRKDIDQARIVATGWSLGAAVAIDLASRRHVAGLVTFSAFTNIVDMSKSLLNGVPLGILLLSSRFDNLAKIGSVSCPILLVHGSQDALVPPEMQSRLAKAARSKLTTIRVGNAGHNDIFLRGGESLYQRVKAFVDDLAGVRPTTQPTR
ncbi:MAG TPA: alpha/beta hydrolase [Tepidisphaeraceae bacterium]|nr:alpha/beta hydrolase [Tepidisphaeraceae bacterium]